MGVFEVGDVVVLPFPFSDLSNRKLRPAVVVAKADFNDLIFCQVTSKDRSERGAIKLTQNSFADGGLGIVSYARPDKLFTGDESIVIRAQGRLKAEKKQELLAVIAKLFKN